MSNLYMASRIMPENQQSFYLIFFLRAITKVNYKPVSLNFQGQKARFTIYRGNQLLNSIKDTVDLNFLESQCKPKKVDLPFMLKTSAYTENVNLTIKINRIQQSSQQLMGEIGLNSSQYIRQFTTDGTDNFDEQKTLQGDLNYKYTIFIGKSLRDVQNASKTYKRQNGYMILSPNRSRQSLIMEGEQRSPRGSSRSNFYSGQSQIIDIGSRIRDWSQRRHSRQKEFISRGNSRVRQKEEERIHKNQSSEKAEDNSQRVVHQVGKIDKNGEQAGNIKSQQYRDQAKKNNQQQNRKQTEESKNKQSSERRLIGGQEGKNQKQIANNSSEQEIVDVVDINCKNEQQKNQNAHQQAKEKSKKKQYFGRTDQYYEPPIIPNQEQQQLISPISKNTHQQIVSSIQNDYEQQAQKLVKESPIPAKNLGISKNSEQEVKDRQNSQIREEESIVLQKTKSEQGSMEKSIIKTGSDWKLTFKILILFIILGFSLVYFGPLAIDQNFDEDFQQSQRSDKKAKRKGAQKNKKKSTSNKNDIQ